MITMTDQTIKNPRIKQGWLRVILFGLAFILVTLLILVPAAMGLAIADKEQLKTDPVHALANLLRGDKLWLMVILEFLVSLITVGIFRIFIDRRSLASLGLRPDG